MEELATVMRGTEAHHQKDFHCYLLFNSKGKCLQKCIEW